MKKIALVIPELKSVLGPELSNYPQGFMWPYTVIVREAWWNHRKVIEDTCTKTAADVMVPVKQEGASTDA